ncbi:efflux RND transporter permease subunit [Desulfallas thermosapovorans]|uniref:HAE1 family hydrophobic/amphiphilic exporter-1 n=1 Tax=Desulfallas thermosapovorans DSM 6562 TaxID=1121431 RepID=A0A5S4ZUW1_9FIRM|nr:efflux RND transporter permease subunit [Desulfallas thermosapovorans]TYO96584.1 HAE1 family hydrophobic/amphiphilic exporter-1 [Desulfallas thermosapovorans DSM 6562]
MKITDISIKRPMLVTVIIIIVLLLGGVSLTRLSIDLFPELELPVAIVSTSYSGVGPEEIEQQITKPLESVLSSVSNLDTISSTSSMGSSTVILMLDWGADMDFAALDIREKIDIIRDVLPDGAGAPTIFKADLNMMPILQVAAHSTDPMGLKQVLDDLIIPRLERVSGVASVWYVGGWEREIQVQVDPVKLNGYGLSLNTLTGALGSENLNFSAGTVREGRDDFLLRVTGEFKNLDQVRRIVVGNFGGSPVYLEDVARVVDGQKKVTQINRVNGEPGIALMINKQSGANTVATSREVRAELEKLQQEVPAVEFDIIMDQAEYIEDSINNLVRSAIEGAILAILVILIFLRNFRSTLIISTSIPIAIIGAFVLLYFNDMTLNMVTLGGLALGIGLIVDDAIVVLENIYRHCGQGLDRVTASRQATDEVGSAVIAASLTVVSVFLPIVFVEGLAAQLFKPMALSISFCILASLAVAITLVPLLSSRWLNVYKTGENGAANQPNPRGWKRVYNASERWFNKIDTYYRALLQKALRRRKLTILLVVVIFVLTLFAIPLLGMEFMPGADQGYVTISVEMPKGTSLSETDRLVREIEGVLETKPGIESISSSVGSSGSMLGGGDSNQAQIVLKMLPLTQRSISSDELATQLSSELQRIPGADINVSAMEQGMGDGGAPVQIQISGDDLDTLAQLGNQVAAAVRQVPGTREVTSSLEEGRPEMHVVVNRDRAAMYGLGLAEVASTVRTAVDGTVATTYRVGGEEVDIRVQLSGNPGEFTPGQLSALTITSPLGALVTLDQVAEIKQDQGPNSINRNNQARIVTINSQLAGRDLGSVTRDIQQKIAEIDMPSGYNVTYGGEQEQMMESFGSLGLALVLAIILVYLVMVAQFESLLYPFVIMFSVPITLTGVVLSLLITGRTFSVVAFIGVIMLVGIVVKNAIVLVDYINILRRRGMERNEAILQAGPVRLRPILMTALTTVMAMFPMALGLGEGGETQAPLATVVVGGLLFSTLITLVLVPVGYTLMDDFTKKVSEKIFRRKSKAGDISMKG